jgi:hypothetical protein
MICSNIFAPAYSLVALQTLTNAYADCGVPIDCREFSKVGVFVTTDVNDSTGIILKGLGQHTYNGTDYEIDGLSTVNLDAADSVKYYEFDCGALAFLQLQVIATVAGATPGKISIEITKR